jgi:hypothetical protein
LQTHIREKSKENKNFYALKCDVYKFFYQIDPEILFQILKRSIKDKDLLNFTRIIIFDNREQFENSNADDVVTKTRGIPIGNYTSQYFANIYMNELDQFVKRELKVKHYVRYMDDFILLLDSKEECKEKLELIKSFLWNKLKLRLNSKTMYFKGRMGVNFCGFRIFKNYMLLKSENKRKINRRIRSYNKSFKRKRLNLTKAIVSITSWNAHARQGQTSKLRKRIINKAKFIVKDEELIGSVYRKNNWYC